tara:strand:+ start:335 stop:1462 length:1128 start_codon:yes stop_codon:yes gene_type:complete
MYSKIILLNDNTNNDIQYEYKRHIPVHIYNFQNVINVNNKIKNIYGFKENLVCTNNLIIPYDVENIFCKSKNNFNYTNIFNKRTYIYRLMKADNMFHFFHDNILPIIKMIFIDQNILDKDISKINCDINIIFIYGHNDPGINNERTIKEKHLQYLRPLTSNKIMFLSEIPNYTLFENIITGPIKYVSSYLNTYTDVDENKNIKFMKYIKQLYYNYYSIQENKSPNKIIILSRKNANTRKMINEQLLFDTLNNNYKNIELLELSWNSSLYDEMKILNEALIFITPHGAGATSSFFIPTNSTCLIINPNGFPFNKKYVDSPSQFKLLFTRNNINIIQFMNDHENDIDLKDDIKNRDKNYYVNINKINKIVYNILYTI